MSGRRRTGISVPSLVRPVVREDRLRSLGDCQRFDAVDWLQEEHLTVGSLFYLSTEVLFQNQWMKNIRRNCLSEAHLENSC